MKLSIVGNGGTDKSTLGDKLAKELNVPVIYFVKASCGRGMVGVRYLSDTSVKLTKES